MKKMTKLEMKVNKLVKRLVGVALGMGYNMQQADHIELNKEEIYELIHNEHLPEIQVIQRFVQ